MQIKKSLTWAERSVPFMSMLLLLVILLEAMSIRQAVENQTAMLQSKATVVTTTAATQSPTAQSTATTSLTQTSTPTPTATSTPTPLPTASVIPTVEETKWNNRDYEILPIVNWTSFNEYPVYKRQKKLEDVGCVVITEKVNLRQFGLPKSQILLVIPANSAVVIVQNPNDGFLSIIYAEDWEDVYSANWEDEPVIQGWIAVGDYIRSGPCI